MSRCVTFLHVRYSQTAWLVPCVLCRVAANPTSCGVDTFTDTTKNPGDVGTVGAVALDSKGHLVAGTSTGGLNGKMVGRCSDSSIIGSGTYADDKIGAVSTTGHGESIAKTCLAHSIIKEMEYGKNVQTAVEQSVKKMTERMHHTAGAITLSQNGDPGIYFSSKKMAWAYQKGDKIHFGIEPNQHETVGE